MLLMLNTPIKTMLQSKSPKLMMTRRVFLFSTLDSNAILLLKAIKMKFMVHLDLESYEEDRGQRRRDVT